MDVQLRQAVGFMQRPAELRKTPCLARCGGFRCGFLNRRRREQEAGVPPLGGGGVWVGKLP